MNLSTFCGFAISPGRQFLLLPHLPLKILLASKVVKIVSKIIISICYSKLLTHSVCSIFLWSERKIFFSVKVDKKKQKVKIEIRSYLDLTFRWTEMSIAELMQRKWPIFLNHFRGWSQSYKIIFVIKMLRFHL